MAANRRRQIEPAEPHVTIARNARRTAPTLFDGLATSRLPALVGVATTWNEAAPAIYLGAPGAAAKSVAAAGGTRASSHDHVTTDRDGHAGMKSSLISREIIADSWN